MPDGIVQWLDAAAGEAAVVRAGRVYRAEARELEPVARHPGARVHFDIHRARGVDRSTGGCVTVVPAAGHSHRERERRSPQLAREPAGGHGRGTSSSNTARVAPAGSARTAKRPSSMS